MEAAHIQVKESHKEKQKKYIENFIKVQDLRVENVKELFGNHYEFLEEWYNECNE